MTRLSPAGTTKSGALWFMALAVGLAACAVEPLPSPFNGDDRLPGEDLDSESRMPDVSAPPPEAEVTGTTLSISLPQSNHGAMWANPDLFPELPVHVHVDGATTSVQVQLGEQIVEAEATTQENDYVGVVSIADLPAGVYTLHASAQPARGDAVTTSAELHLGTDGVQFTDFDTVGRAVTPRLHRRDDGLWLTWSDRRTDPSRVWLQAVDGAGAGLGEPTALTPPDADVVSGRTVPGNTTLAILYQTKGLPYTNWVRIVDWTGAEVMAAMALDPADSQGSWGGDISFDGEGYVLTWRSYNDEKSEIHWARVHEESLTLTGPVVVTQTGQEDPVGDFLPFAFLAAEALGEHTVITFVRDHYDSLLDMSVGRCQAAVVHQDGSVIQETLLPTPLSLPFGFQAFVHAVHGELALLWTAVSLYDEELNPPHRIFGAKWTGSDADDLASLSTQLLLQGPTERGEMTLIEHPTHYATMAWTDQRSKEDDPVDGRIQLFTATVSEELQASAHTVIPHARFIQDTSQVNGQASGTNTILVWLDERHGGTVGNSHPEVYFETLWK